MSKKPLNVRVAEALGWKFLEDGRQRHPSLRGPWWIDPAGDATTEVPPYGADTPEGWACTGPLIQRFGLIVEPVCYLPRWICYTSDDLGDEIVREEVGSNACAAVAEWVARYGSEK